jgi:DNA ligase-1
MTFKKLANYFAQLEKTASRNQMTEILAKLFRASGGDEIDKICYLSLGRLAPLYAGIEFNLAEKTMVRALAQAYNQEEKTVRGKYKRLGDLGDTAAFFDKKTSARPLSVATVHQQLERIALDSGTGSVERKIQGMAKLLDDLDGVSSKYIVRIPLSKLRLGFSDKTILDGLSWMIAGDKSKRAVLDDAYNVRADVGQIAKMVKKKGLRGLKAVKVSLGVPIMPALCQRLPTVEKMIEKMVLRPAQDKVAAEPKFDGTRLQVHFSRRKNWTAIFTRNLENVTHMFPDITKAVFAEVKAKEAILDGEGIGFDPKTGKFLVFQKTMQRKRKYEVGQKAKEIPFKYFAFDVLYKDCRDFIKTPFSKRRQILAKMIATKGKTITLAPQIVTNDVAELRRYHDKQIKAGLEGAVVKKWEASYDPGKRGYTWVKFKQEKGKKGGGLADTLDCVVMGYYRGRGKRASFGIGGFLVGVRKSSKFLTISKIGTGLSDDQWREMHRKCQSVKVSKLQSKPKEYEVDKNLFPDVWCAPKIVVEIEADNITKSPIHTAEYALRFPRLIRFRDDKSPSQATTLSEAIKLYKLQKLSCATMSFDGQ